MSVRNFWYFLYFLVFGASIFGIFQPERLEQNLYLFSYLTYCTAICMEHRKLMKLGRKQVFIIEVYNSIDAIFVMIPAIMVSILGYLWQEDSYDTNILIGTVGSLYLGKIVLLNIRMCSLTEKTRWYYPIGYLMLANSFWELAFLIGWVGVTAPIQIFS